MKKRERRPPKTWRRNMLAGVALLAVLDATILSPTPDLVRTVFALAVTAVVGGFIVAVWISNSRLEKTTSSSNTDRGPAGSSSRGGDKGRPGRRGEA